MRLLASAVILGVAVGVGQTLILSQPSPRLNPKELAEQRLIGHRVPKDLVSQDSSQSVILIGRHLGPCTSDRFLPSSSKGEFVDTHVSFVFPNLSGDEAFVPRPLSKNTSIFFDSDRKIFTEQSYLNGPFVLLANRDGFILSARRLNQAKDLGDILKEAGLWVK